MKKLIALILCLLMTVGLVACGGTTTVTEETTEAVEESVEAVIEIETANNGLPEDLSFEGQELTVWTSVESGTDGEVLYESLVDEFEAMTGATVTTVHHGRDLNQILDTALDAGEKIDVYPLGSTIQLKSNFEHTLDLTEYIENSDVLQRVYPIHMDIIRQQSPDGEAYHAIPTVSSFNSFWYNKAIFEAAGIEKTPETIEEFEAACDAIVAAGYYPMALDGAYGASTFGAMVERMVGEKTVGEMAMNGGFAENERFVAACQKVIDWKAKGYFEPGAPGVFPASQNMIGITQDTAMVYCGMWVSKEIEEASGAKLDWGCFKFPEDPTCEEGTYGAAVSCTCNVVNANTEVADLAWAFTYYMCTGEANKARTDENVYLVDDMSQPALARFEEAQKIMMETTEYVNYAGGLHDNADIKASVNDVITRLYSGEFADGLEAAQAFDALLGQ